MAVTHKFSSAKADGADATLVRPSNWNDAHDVQDSFQIVFDGAGSTITTGVKNDIICPYTGHIVAWTILPNASGSIVFDIWKDTYANFPPTVGDTITGAGKPTLTATTKATGTVSWAFTKGDVLRFNVDSVTTVTRVTLILETIQP